jgi:acid phosphatase class B
MNLALDYDDTYTRDPIFWDLMIDLAQSRGHKVYCITARSERHTDEVYDDLEKRLGHDAILFTAGNAKKSYAYSKDINIDVWIDDNPNMIITGIKIDDAHTGLW